MLSSWCPYKLFVFAVIMATAPAGFPVPQMQEGLDEREALDFHIGLYRLLHGDGMVRAERRMQI